VANEQGGTHLTRFTGTKVEILTQKALFFVRRGTSRIR